MSITPQEQLALDELRRSYDIYSSSSDTLDRKAGQLLSSASLITALLGSLQITLIKPGQSLVYWLGLGVALLALLALVGMCTSVLNVKSYKIPVPADWKKISPGILQVTPNEAIRKVISSYTTYISLNRRLNTEKANRLRRASVLLFFIVAILLTLSLFQSG